MVGGQGGCGLYDDVAMCRSEAPPGGERQLIRGGGGGGGQLPGSVMNSDSRTPVVMYHLPLRGLKRLCPPADTHDRRGTYEELVRLPLAHGPVEKPVPQLAHHRSTQQSDRQPVNVVRVSAVMIDVIPVPVDNPVPTSLASAKSSIDDTSSVVRQMASEDNPYMEGMVVTDPDFRDCVVGGPTSAFLRSSDGIVDLAGDVTVGVSSPADLAGDVTVGVSSPADLAGGVTVGVAPSVIAGVASPADLAEVASSGRPC